MKAIESVMCIFAAFIKEFSMFMLLSKNLTFGNSGSFSCETILYLSSIFGSGKHSITFNLLFKFFQFYSFDLVMSKLVFKELFHFLCFLFISTATTLLLSQESSIEINSVVLKENQWFSLVIFLSLLHGFESISSVASNKKDPEEAECQNSLSHIEVLVDQANPKPDISKDGYC